MTNRKRNVIRGLLSSISSSLVLQVTSLLVIPLYLDLTSQELYGLWLALGAILAWIKIGDMGLGLALTKRSVEALEKDDYKLLSRLIYGTILSTLFFGAIVSGAGYFLDNLIINIFSISDYASESFRETFYLLLIIAFIRPGLGSFSSIINAKQHIAFLHIKNTSITLLSILINIGLLLLDFGILSFAYGLLFEALATPIVDIIYLKRIDKKIELLPLKTSLRDIKSLLSFGLPYQALKIANLVATNTDNIIIAAFLGASSVTVYVFTGKLAFLLAVFLVSILPSVLFPGISQLFVNNEIEKIKHLYLKLSDFSIRLGVFSGICYFYVNESFINIWVGPENFGGIELTSIFVIWILFESFTRGITSIIYASGDFGGLTLISFCEAALNICITLLLINNLGLIGVVLGTVLSRLLIVLYIPFKINMILNIQNRTFIASRILKTIYYAIPLLLIGELLSKISFSLIHPFLEIVIICGVMLMASLFSLEGIFLLRNRKKSWQDRIRMLKEHYYS